MATFEPFERLVKAAPGGERAAWRGASRYVAGRSRTEALSTSAGLLRRGHGVSVDLFGELVDDPITADGVSEDYLSLVAALLPPADAWLSLNLTHLTLDADPAGAADRLASIARALPAGRRVQVGAEDATRTDPVLTCVLKVASRGLADRVGATVQSNLLRSPADVDVLTQAGVHIRLVRAPTSKPAGHTPTASPPTRLPTPGVPARRGRCGLVDGYP